MSVPKHGRHCVERPSYDGRKLPRGNDCMDCWRMYFYAHKDEPITGAVMFQFMSALQFLRFDASRDALSELADIIRYPYEE